MPSPRTRGRTLLVGFLFALCACDGQRGKGGLGGAGPNILLVTLDTTRADHLGTYGYFRETSPTLDALAEESIVFERAIVPMATTLPTHLSILTATYPLEHGVLANTFQGGERFVPSPALRSVAALAAEAGYRTAAFVSAAPLKRGTGVENGFETFDQPSGKQRDGRETTDAALAWLRGLDARPFLLWVHYYDAHWPFTPPAPFDAMYRTDDALERYIAERRIHPTAPRPLVKQVDEARSAINAYDGELRYQDTQLARLFDALRVSGDWSGAVVLVVGDHGEGLCQHGEAAHGGTWNEQLHAPMLMRVPGVPPRRVSRVVSAVDLFPTLLSLIDLPALAALRSTGSGRDALAEGASPPVLSQDTGRTREVPYRYALTLERWKYFWIEHHDGRHSEQLYDLGSDPFELADVALQHPALVEELRGALQNQLEELRRRGEALRGGQAPQLAPVDPTVVEQLRELGYLEAP